MPSTGEWPIKTALQGGRFLNLRKAINGCYESIADDETLVTLDRCFHKEYCKIIITLWDFYNVHIVYFMKDCCLLCLSTMVGPISVKSDHICRAETTKNSIILVIARKYVYN